MTRNLGPFVGFVADLDECAADPTLCGATGTCSNIPDGMFYSCACGEGFRLNDGDPAMQELDCEGTYMFIFNYARDQLKMAIKWAGIHVVHMHVDVPHVQVL